MLYLILDDRRCVDREIAQSWNLLQGERVRAAVNEERPPRSDVRTSMWIVGANMCDVI